MRTVSFLLFFVITVTGQTFEFWPGAQYDPAIPSPEKVLGYELGKRHATHADIVQYFESLAAAAPGRMKVFEYARSWEGRKLIYAVIASESNFRKIDEIKAGVKQLADPRKTSAAVAQGLISSQPAVIGLSYGVHGNEISSPDAAMMTAYHLLAARNDKLLDEVMSNVVVLIDPLQNPDGRDRFVHNFRMNEGLEPDASPAAAERVEPWPGGRSNHYLFDMNRDWFALTQPETLGRVKYLGEWQPLIHVDLHEMGTESTYFFAPGSAPYNPYLTSSQKEQMSWFGRNNAKWFDKFGYSYFTREVFDEFYPGYGASWPWYYGGMGMTYENASVRGLIVRKPDETLYTFQDSVRKHFVASIATCETAAQNRQKLLGNFWNYNRTAVEEGASEPVKEYIIPRAGDTSAVDKLAHILALQGVEVKRARGAFRNGGKEYPAGSYIVVAAQPRKRLLRALMESQVAMDQEFVKEQERRRRKNLRDQIYDVTAWSLPMLYNVQSVNAAEVSKGDFEPISGEYKPAGSVTARAEVAYLVPWGSQAAGRFLTAALRSDLKLLSTNKPFTLNGNKFPSGTLVVMVKENGPNVHETISKLADASGVHVIATDSSWVDDGINFGSNNTARMKKPAIALAWDSPTSSLAAGQTRFVLERQYGYPVTVIRTATIGSTDLSKFDVLILPPGGGAGGGYSSALGGSAGERIRNWVRSGGVLIGIGGAVSWLSSPQVGLLAIQQEALAQEGSSSGKAAEGAKPQTAAGGSTPASAPASSGPVPGKILASDEDYLKAIRGDRELPDPIAGALLRARIDPELWITAGLPETLHVLFDGREIFTPLKRDKGVNAVILEGPDKLVASGLVWEENRKQLAYKPFVVVQNEGRGAVVGFTADPNFRAYMDGLNVLFLNAVFRAPAIGGRAPGSEEVLH